MNGKSKGDFGRLKKEGCGSLYVVATPIGNLEDITLRALKVLKEVDIIGSENKAQTKRLCSRHHIMTKLISYNQHNRKARAPELIRAMRAGKDVAVVTDAGTPGISDPGAYLVDMAFRQGIKVSPVPGASAVMAAISASGIVSKEFVFLGFLSSRAGRRRKKLKELGSESRAMVIFESPRRAKALLFDIINILGDRKVAVFRELTKVFEEVRRAPASQVVALMEQGEVKGELTLVLEGKEEGKENEHVGSDVLDRIDELLAEGSLTVRDIADKLSREEGLGYRKIYKECLARKTCGERYKVNAVGQEDED